MWIADGEKYALVGLKVKLEGTLAPEQIAPSLWALTTTTFDVPSQWREWLGSIRTDEVAGSSLFLVSKFSSAAPGVLDGENQLLQRRVHHFYVGLLLSAMFSPSHKPVMLTGARWDGVTDIRQKMDLEVPAPQVFRAYPPVVADDIVSAAQLGLLTAEQRCPTRGGRAVRSRRRKNAPPMVPCRFWRGAGDVRRGALCGGTAGGCR